MSAADLAVTLQEFSALSSLSEDHLHNLSLAAQKVQYRSGSWLCREGDEGSCCYFLLRGSVSISKQLGDGRKVYLATLIAGHLLGQTGLVPGQLRTADVTATSDLDVLVLERAALNRALKRGERWASALQHLIASHLVRQLRGALGRLESLAGQEDAQTEAQGRKRSDVAQPKSLSVNFGAKRGERPGHAQSHEHGSDPTATRDLPPLLEEDKWVPLPPVVDTTREELYELLQATEAGLGSGVDYQLETVRVVIDEDVWGRKAL